MGIVIRPRTPKSAPEAKIERTEAPTTQEVGMKKCKLCEEEHPVKSFKKYEGVEMCAECYAIEKEGLEDDKLEELCEKAHTKEKATKEVAVKPKKEKIKIAKKEQEVVKMKSSGKPIGEKVYTKIVEFQGSWGPVQQMFLIATDPRFFEPDSKIKPLALGGFKASLIAKMMSGEVEGPTIFEYVEKHATKYMGGK
jgi:hypothetical protein